MTGRPGVGFAFVGRRSELALATAALRHPPAVLLVEGEAGIGKSRLIAEATAGTAALVLTGSCHPLRAPLPFGPVMDALRAVGPALPPPPAPPTLPPSTGALAPLLPDLADRLPPAVETADRHRLAHAVRALLAALGEVVLVIEDLHWADEATRELLLLLAHDLPPGLSLLLSYRAEDLPPDTPVLGAAYRRPPGVAGALLRLGPLAEAEVHELARSALGPAATPALAELLYRRSEGLPLVAEEDLITLGETGDPPADLVGELERSEVPRGLRDAVTERLAALPPAGEAVVAAAAVLGVPAGEQLLAEVAGLTPQAAAEGLTAALRAAVLREDPPTRYTFRHVLAQQVAYRRLLGPHRGVLHRRAVAVLEAQHPRPLVQLAHHTLALGDRPGWQRLAEAAAEQAVALGDSGSAETLLRRLLAEPELDPDRRGRVALTLARIAANGTDSAASTQTLTAMLADPRLAPGDRGEIRLTLGILIATHAGDRAGFDQLALAVDELTDRPIRASRALVALAMNERGGEGRLAAARLDRAERLLVDHPDQAAAAAVRATRLTFQARQGDPAVWTGLAALPRAAENPEVLRQSARALFNTGDIAVELGHDQRAGQLLREARRLARQAAIPYLECYSRIALLRLDGLAGHWDGLAERFAALGAEFPDLAMAESERSLLLGRLAAARGRLAVAQREFTAAARFGDRESQVTTALRAAAGLAGLRLAEGDTAQATATLAPAVAALRAADAWARSAELLPVAVECALAEGERRAAAELVEQAEQGLANVDAPAALAALEQARGQLLAGPDQAGARAAFTRARELWWQIGRPYQAARAEEQLAVALSGPEPEAAADRLAAAEQAYLALGATSDAARCQRLRRDLGLGRTPTPGRRGYGALLSPRELQVAELVAQGASNQDVAQALFLSPRTVERHVANLLHKLGVTRKELGPALAAGAGTQRSPDAWVPPTY
ncbi:LuxR family transcriptional regulator [Streptomyces tateyamensis]|uniref:LuxR family transcriptional regulator n=1 Tax=Streptomyces tateyamensis TaxID=565073 RepID=A0A2V4MXI7_9ACTN|nr:LuxR family transcriptional regulator [Streptomyces tateyamensis]PYC75804.1 LuxR family transcriptional regulator [Streptomyces tateyamensis]